MPPFTEDPERNRPLLRPPGRAGRRARAERGCRWAPPRTTRWPSRRARRSSGSAACSTRARSRPARRSPRSRPTAARPARPAATCPRPRPPARRSGSRRAYSCGDRQRVQVVHLVARGHDQHRDVSMRWSGSSPSQAIERGIWRSAWATSSGCSWRSMRWRTASRAISRQPSAAPRRLRDVDERVHAARLEPVGHRVPGAVVDVAGPGGAVVGGRDLDQRGHALGVPQRERHRRWRRPSSCPRAPRDRARGRRAPPRGPRSGPGSRSWGAGEEAPWPRAS